MSSPRERLLQAAYSMVAEKGLEGLRTRDVVAEAGVNISTLHYYFGTKDDLVLAVVDYAREQFSRGATDDAVPSLRAHLRAAWVNFERDPRLPRVLQELAQRAQRDPVVRKAFRGLFRHWNAMVEEAALGKRNARSTAHSRATANIVTSFVMGALTQLSVDGRAFDFEATAAVLLQSLQR